MSPEEWQAELRYLRERATLDWCSDALALIPWWRWFPRLLVRLIMRKGAPTRAGCGSLCG